MYKKILCIIFVLLLIIPANSYSQQFIDIGLKRQLFIDDYLIDRINGLALTLNTPQEVQSANIPNGYYQTIIKTDSIYRIYYRDNLSFWKGEKYDGNPGEITKSAISKDGYTWQKENTGLNDSITNFIYYEPPFNHNLTPFKDLNPQAQYPYKALSGTKATGGLFYFYSNDGKEFKKKQDKPVIKSDTTYHEFDSQNIAFWSAYENQYICYFRRSLHWCPLKNKNCSFKSLIFY